jgi:hypothetical protein
MRTLDRFVLMHSVWLVIILCLGLAIPVHAVTIFSEDFEVADMTALQARGWALSCSSSPCTTDLVSSPVHGGSKALRMMYPPGQDGSDGNSSYNSHIDRSFSGVPEIYERYYVRYENYDPAQASGFANATKQHYFNTGSLPNFVSDYEFGDNHINFVNQTASVTTNLYSNVGTVPSAYGVWQCIETHLNQTTAELWVDGTLTVQYTNAVGPAAYNYITVYRQAAVNQIRYEDDYVIATTRIGCSGSPSANTTPPAAPFGLVVR